MAEVNAKANIAALQQEERELPLTQDSIDGYLEYLRSIGRALTATGERLGGFTKRCPKTAN